MKINRKQQILAFIKKKGETNAKDIVNHLGITEAAVFRHLKTLIEQGDLSKSGTSPKVFYYLNENKSLPTITFPEAQKAIIDSNFYLISPLGKIMEGEAAFTRWCADRNLDPLKTASDYVNTLAKYDAYKHGDYIDGLEKMRATFPTVYLDEVYYLDFYSMERFGKTKLGWLLLHAKQTQNKKLSDTIGALVKMKILNLIIEKKIDAVGFIPATIRRKVQFQKELERHLNLSLPVINLIKTQNDVAVPQKSLSKLEDRIANARNSIFVSDERKFNNVLLIDDAVGSGATLNETAKKIKERGLCTGKIIGLALTGSFKGFDVINEV